ncbi:MAG: nitrilase-related carbon-nitrogen hydrolase [Fimbriimonadales bacterium]
MIRVAAVAWKLREVRSDSEFFGHFYDLVNEAHRQGAEVVVLPELQVLELLNIEPELAEHKAARYLAQYGDAMEEWLKRISGSSGMTLVGGSYFKETPHGIVNVCAIADPGRGLALGTKNNLTTYERKMWNLHPGNGLAKPHDPRIGVTICYDCEFPESGRALAEEGVLVQCVPAFTETKRGFQRVRWSCKARAIENQNFVVHASLLGSLGREPAPSSYGSSAILTPSIEPFPVSAILAETPLGEEGVIVADLDLNMLEQARESGDVRNWNDRHSGEWLMRRES